MTGALRPSLCLAVATLLVSTGELARGQRSAATATPAGMLTGVTFTNISREAGLDFVNTNGASPDKHLVETMGSGGVLFDYNNDGWLDILLLDGGSLVARNLTRAARHRLYRNRQDGTYEDVTAASGIQHPEYGMGACAGDYDNDGAVDLYITNFGANTLLRNRRDGSFVDTTRTAGVGATLWSTSCAFADLDRDGDLDLFVTNYVQADLEHAPFCGNAKLKLRFYCHPLNFDPLPNILYRNNGNGTFTDWTEKAGIARHRGNGLGVVVADFDDDQWPDVFVANDGVPNFLFFNERGVKLTEAGLPAGVAIATDGRARAGMGTDAADYDGDGRLDLIVTNLDLESHSLFRNLGGRLFAYATPESGLAAPTLPYVGWGVALFDYDNDTHLDIAIANGHVIDNAPQFRAGAQHAQRRLLFRNVNGRRFMDAGRSAGPGFEVERVGRGLAAGDIDNDGDLDLLITSNGGPVELLRNDGGNGQNALLIQAIGKASNRDGIGARLRLTAESRTQVREIKAGSSYLSQNDVRAHFGLGRATQAERLEIRWPSGRVDTLSSIPANHIVTIREGEGIVKKVAFKR
ncbi:MAG TPA: CRTAC1 family protein [Vicinamibacterales bacterium]|nr:CRTAC1 family protein [Vicinamibacterales bacterium]